MIEEYGREKLVKDKNELEKEIDLVRNIIKTREELKNNNINFELAELDLVDYYIYEIKANQAKLDYLLKIAKAKGITLDRINQLRYENYEFGS
jgi:hypothetical protein